MAVTRRVADAETLVPTSDEQGQLVSLVEALEARGKPVSAQPAIVTGDGERFDLSPQLADLVVHMLRALADGQAVTVMPRQRLLTTQEAADMLGMSRPTLIKVLERGELPFERVGRHRRIHLPDLLAYDENVRRRRAEALDEMVRDAEEAGLYELLDGPPPKTR